METNMDFGRLAVSVSKRFMHAMSSERLPLCTRESKAHIIHRVLEIRPMRLYDYAIACCITEGTRSFVKRISAPSESETKYIQCIMRTQHTNKHTHALKYAHYMLRFLTLWQRVEGCCIVWF